MEQNKKPDLKQTQEALTRKVALTRLGATDIKESEAKIGWEFVPPYEGDRYTVYLINGTVLMTSPVQQIKETDHSVTIRTINSTYELKYLD